MGDIRRAPGDANTAVQLAPGCSFVYRSRGFLYDDLGRIDLAIADFNLAVRIDGRDAGLRVERGRLLAKNGQLGEAIADFSTALEIDSKRFAALLERGKAYSRQGNVEAAVADLSLFVRLEPDNEEGANALAVLGRLPTAAAAVPPPPAADRDKIISSGTGFFVSIVGHIVTNAHVVERCVSLFARDNSGNTLPATPLATDRTSDLALLKVSTDVPAIARFRTGIRTGEEVAAFGFPLAGLLATSGNFTVGNVSALAGLHDNAGLLQISTPVQPGNSGGPLVDRSGNVVGVIVSKLDTLKVASVIDDVPQNVNFAIKASVVMNFLDAAGVSYSVQADQSPLAIADVADRARSFAVWITCAR